MNEHVKRAQDYRARQEADRVYLTENVSEWEPSYGFCASNETDRMALAMTLEQLRRQVCCYGGGNRCDCKYGLRVERGAVLNEFGVKNPEGTARSAGSEQTGCPELREIIHSLLHRDQPLI